MKNAWYKINSNKISEIDREALLSSIKLQRANSIPEKRKPESEAPQVYDSHSRSSDLLSLSFSTSDQQDGSGCTERACELINHNQVSNNCELTYCSSHKPMFFFYVFFSVEVTDCGHFKKIENMSPKSFTTSNEFPTITIIKNNIQHIISCNMRTLSLK